MQSSIAQCPLAHPDDSSHRELLICSAAASSCSDSVTRDAADVPGVISDYTVIKCEYLQAVTPRLVSDCH